MSVVTEHVKVRPGEETLQDAIKTTSRRKETEKGALPVIECHLMSVMLNRFFFNKKLHSLVEGCCHCGWLLAQQDVLRVRAGEAQLLALAFFACQVRKRLQRED